MKSHIIENLFELKPLPTAELHGIVLEMQNAGEKIIDLTIGISNLPIPDAAKIAAILSINNDKSFYTAISGDSKLKLAIQQKLIKQNELDYELDSIIVTTGAKQAIFESLYILTKPGDHVAIIRPYWPAHTQALKILKLVPFVIELDDIIRGNKIPNNPNVKVLLIDLPNNPTGKIFTVSQLISLLKFAKENNIYIIADESYEKLIYEGNHTSLATLDESMKDSILTVFSASQSYSMMGWRIGYAAGNKKIISALESVQSIITSATSYLSQTALTAALATDKTYNKNLITEFKKRRDTIFPKLTSIPWMECELPSSGPYFWCNIEKLTTDSAEFCTRLLEKEKIAVMPGDAFGTPGWIRIAFNIMPVAVLEDAVSRISSFGNTYEQ